MESTLSRHYAHVLFYGHLYTVLCPLRIYLTISQRARGQAV